jgi:hypothetical protein
VGQADEESVRRNDRLGAVLELGEQASHGDESRSRHF